MIGVNDNYPSGGQAMELGQRLRQARLEAGLSQRQLCGSEITRNMLSLIENGSAKPSMKTLQYLAARLGKSVSYFLEETAVLSPNLEIMVTARQLFDAGNFSAAQQILEDYQSPDPVYDREKEILWVLIRLELADEAIRQKRFVYAQNLLQQTPVKTAYLETALVRKKLLLLGRLPQHQVSELLPSLDDELLLRASEAFTAGDFHRAGHLLDAMEKQTATCHLLQGKLAVRQKQWENAAGHLRHAETEFPEDSFPLLEICYRELGDFQKAYEYACRQRN